MNNNTLQYFIEAYQYNKNIFHSRTDLNKINSKKRWEEQRRQVLTKMLYVMGNIPSRIITDSLNYPLNINILSKEILDDVVRIQLNYTAEEDDIVPAILIMPKNCSESNKKPALLCPHQTTKDNRIGKKEPAGISGEPNLYYALELSKRGYITLTIDYPKFGEYDFPVYERGYQSVTMKGLWNHLRAVDLLESLDEVDSNNIGCIGHSLGGTNSIFLACFDNRIKVIVSSCGFTTFDRYAATSVQGDLTGWARPHKYMPKIATEFKNNPENMPFEFTEIIASLAPRPLFINACINDEIFDINGVKECILYAEKIYELYDAKNNIETIFPEDVHNFPLIARKKAYDFIDIFLNQ